MKKIYTTLAALALCAMSSSAAITVTLDDGTPVADGQTLTVNRSEFIHTYYPGLIDQWTGKIHINVTGQTPTAVALKGSSGDIMFCPVGGNCYNLFESAPGVYEGDGTLEVSPVNIPVDMNYFNVGDDLPQEVQTLEATFTDSSNAKFVVNFIFDTREDSGVDGVVSDDTVNVFTIAGYKVLDAAPAEALSTLPAGLYIVNGKKIIVK